MSDKRIGFAARTKRFGTEVWLRVEVVRMISERRWAVRTHSWETDMAKGTLWPQVENLEAYCMAQFPQWDIELVEFSRP